MKAIGRFFFVALWLGAAMPVVAQSAAVSSEASAAEDKAKFLQLVDQANKDYARANFAPAKKAYEEALVVGKRAQVNKPDLAVVLSDLGMLDKLTFQLEDAQNCLIEAIPLAGDDQSLLAILQTRLSSILRARGNLYGALDHAQTAVELRQQLSPNTLLLAEALNNVAVLDLELKKSEAAADCCDQALKIIRAVAPEGSAEEAAVTSTRAAIEIENSNYDKARELLTKTLQTQEKIFGNKSLKLCTTLNNLGMTYCKERQYKEAQPYLERVLSIAESASPVDVATAADASASLGDLFARMKDSERAGNYFKKAVELAQSINYRHLADIKDQYASFILGEDKDPATEKNTVEKSKALPGK